MGKSAEAIDPKGVVSAACCERVRKPMKGKRLNENAGCGRRWRGARRDTVADSYILQVVYTIIEKMSRRNEKKTEKKQNVWNLRDSPSKTRGKRDESCVRNDQLSRNCQRENKRCDPAKRTRCKPSIWSKIATVPAGLHERCGGPMWRALSSRARRIASSRTQHRPPAMPTNEQEPIQHRSELERPLAERLGPSAKSFFYSL